MTLQTVWFDSDGRVRCVESGESSAVVRGCEKATSDPGIHGELTIRHTVTVEDGAVTDSAYHAPRLGRGRSEPTAPDGLPA